MGERDCWISDNPEEKSSIIIASRGLGCFQDPTVWQDICSEHLEKESASGIERTKMGTLEQYYIQSVKQPAFLIRTPTVTMEDEGCQNAVKNIYKEIRLLPLEYIFSLKRN